MKRSFWKFTYLASAAIFHPFDCIGDSEWDHNWDRRQPESLMKWQDKKDIGTLEEYDNKVQTLTTKARRHIILVRHGQYNTSAKNDAERILTELGMCQRTGLTCINDSSTPFAEGSKHLPLVKRLKELDYGYSTLVTSTMQRAMETSNFILDSVRLPHSHDEMLEEGFPFIPKPERYKDAHRQAECLKHGSRIEAAFRRYFWRANVDQTRDSYDILVCHANVIRYFVCRALQYPPESWLRMSLPHASITWITIMPDGRVILRCFGDSGHLTPSMITRS